MKKSVFSLVLHTRENADTSTENADTFTTREDRHIYIYNFFFQKKSKFSFYFILKGELRTFFSWVFLVRLYLFSVFIGYNFGCKLSLP